ncbi:hypothetical protein M405DRAFT_468436 [Rhizopogon salebrosus TDB-379]|nr:hypothetical protein M405DRAFT_468436 [Rhizopogon salebrosus TDB-379]
MASHVPTYGDVRSQTATYPTDHLPPVHHSQQISASVRPTVEGDMPAQHRPFFYTRGSFTDTDLTEEPAPMMPNEETTTGKKRKRADTDQLNTSNKTFARRAPSSTEKRGELAKKSDTPTKAVRIWSRNKRQSTRQTTRQLSTSVSAPHQRFNMSPPTNKHSSSVFNCPSYSRQRSSPSKSDQSPPNYHQWPATMQVRHQHSSYYKHYDKHTQAQIHPPRSSRMILSGPHNSHKLLPLNMPDRYRRGYGAAPHVSTYGDICSSNTTYPTEYTPYLSQMSYSPVPDPRHHSSRLPSMHRSQQTLLSISNSGQNDARMSKQLDSLEDAPTGERGKQDSLDSAPYSLQDLTKELQGRSPFAIASGGFGDIWKCHLVKSNGIIEVGSASSIP